MPDVSNEVTVALDGYIREAVELRMLAELPPVSASIVDIQATLLDLRRRQDRVEELLRLCIRIRARARRAADTAAAAADDAWDEAVVAHRTASVKPGDEYMSGRERAAHANLATLYERRAARQAAELAHVTEEAAEVLRTTYWGLSSVRDDIRELLRTLAFESHLER